MAARKLLPAVLALALLAGCSNPNAAPPLQLTDQHGAPWSLRDQRGKAVLLTFGFTHCADTCPATLAKLSRATGALGNRSDVVIAFVTVDPERDTTAAVRAFVDRFGDTRIAGLTGTPAQIDAVDTAYHVWAQRIPGAHGKTGAYDIAHSSVIFFIDPSGQIRSVKDDDTETAQIAQTVRAMLGS